MKFFIISVLLCVQIQNHHSARILGISPSPAYSHQQAFQPIWKALAKRGHDLVVITANPLNDPTLPNLKEIDISFSYKIKESMLTNIIKDKDVGLAMFKSFAEFGEVMVTKQLEHSEIQGLIHNDSLHFDLLMFEFLTPVFGALAHKFKCPTIGLMSYEIDSDSNAVLGNPQHPAVAPSIFLPSYKNLNFAERLQSSVLHFVWPLIYKCLFEGYANEVIRRFFGEEYPSVMEVMHNVDLIFTNANKVFKLPTTMAPNVIEYGGGVHLRDPRPLPDDLEKFIKSSKNGVVCISFGSNVRSDHVDERLRNVILETLASLPYDILWKFEEEIIKDNPRVKIVKWAPQQDILRHPNVKAFVTQGGIQSLEEALYSHVPVVVLPFFGDQPRNAKMVEQLDIGKYFHCETVTSLELKEAIIQVASEPKYKKKMIELAKLSRDKPMTGIDSVVWWTEYVIRNKGAKHLRSLLIDLPWYQYYLLDVIGSIALCLTILLFILIKIFRIICYCFCKLFKNKKIKTQ